MIYILTYMLNFYPTVKFGKHKPNIRINYILMANQNTSKETTTWPELAIGLYDKLTGRNAEISYKFEDFELHVPSNASKNGEASNYAKWKMNGTLKITTRDDVK